MTHDNGGRAPQRARRTSGGAPDQARSAAYYVLRAVSGEGAYTNLTLPGVLTSYQLSGRDAAFVTELVSGTVRWLGTYDAIINANLTRARLQPEVRDILRLGVHQLLAMRVPSHAAIDTSVSLTRRQIGRGPTGLVNAVLRRIGDKTLETWVKELPAATPRDRLALSHAHPRWVVDALGEALAVNGRAEELTDLLEADNRPPRVMLVARPGRAELVELPGSPGRWSPYAVELAGGEPGAIPAVIEGRAGVQDEGSQLVALALVDAALGIPLNAPPDLDSHTPTEPADEKWIDLCAGPGGKAALLAALAMQRGAELTANERAPHRAELVRRTLHGYPSVTSVTVNDATQSHWPIASFDRVLLDVPCSGLGALRRRPEARWRKQPDDLVDLTRLQHDLLVRNWELVKPGGVLLYATCSPVLAETEGVVTQALRSLPGARLRPLSIGVDDAEGPVRGTVQLWPHRHGTDAMFMALFEHA